MVLRNIESFKPFDSRQKVTDLVQYLQSIKPEERYSVIDCAIAIENKRLIEIFIIKCIRQKIYMSFQSDVTKVINCINKSDSLDNIISRLKADKTDTINTKQKKTKANKQNVKSLVNNEVIIKGIEAQDTKNNKTDTIKTQHKKTKANKKNVTSLVNN